MNTARRQMMDIFSMRVTSHANCHVGAGDAFAPVLTEMTSLALQLFYIKVGQFSLCLVQQS